MRFKSMTSKLSDTYSGKLSADETEILLSDALQILRTLKSSKPHTTKERQAKIVEVYETLDVLRQNIGFDSLKNSN